MTAQRHNVRQNGGHPGGRAAFPTLPTSPRLTAGASFALVVSQACVPTCPEYMSPCPKPFDVAAWCGDTNCQLDMQPAQCAEFLGCRARRGQKLSIPISRFYASLDAYDLKLSLSSAGCSGVAVAPEEFIVQLDGVAGTPSSLHYANEAVFTWAPFPEAPTVLPLVRGTTHKSELWSIAAPARIST